MIELIPAIDLIDGKCVRLTKGDYGQKTVYSESPLQMARLFERKGLRRLHLVDLDGAKSRHVVNDRVLRDICMHTSLTVDFGGGVKSDEDIEKAFGAGAAMVTAGSIAVTSPETVARWIERYGADKIVLGADVLDGKVRINGWKDNGDTDLTTLLTRYMGLGVRNVLCTDISKDGMLQGPNTPLYRQIMDAFPDCHLIASGGVSCEDDILELDREGIPAVVFGKAFYEGRIDIDRLQETLKKEG